MIWLQDYKFMLFTSWGQRNYIIKPLETMTGRETAQAIKINPFYIGTLAIPHPLNNFWQRHSYKNRLITKCDCGRRRLEINYQINFSCARNQCKLKRVVTDLLQYNYSSPPVQWWLFIIRRPGGATVLINCDVGHVRGP